MYYNFEKDLYVSKHSIARVCDIITRKGATVLDIGNTKDYDILFELDNKQYMVEVKEDFLALKTGNVAVEYMSRGKDSGILSSKSPIWVYVIGGEAYFTTKNKILDLLKNNDFKKVRGGDNGTSELVLVPLRSFLEICKSGV